MHGIIIGLLDLSDNFADCGLYRTCSRCGPTAGFCEDVDEPLGFIRTRLLFDWLFNYLLSRKILYHGVSVHQTGISLHLHICFLCMCSYRPLCVYDHVNMTSLSYVY